MQKHEYIHMKRKKKKIQSKETVLKDVKENTNSPTKAKHEYISLSSALLKARGEM